MLLIIHNQNPFWLFCQLKLHTEDSPVSMASTTLKVYRRAFFCQAGAADFEDKVYFVPEYVGYNLTASKNLFVNKLVQVSRPDLGPIFLA